MTDKMLGLIIVSLIIICGTITYFHPLTHKIKKEIPSPVIVTVPSKTDDERFKFAVGVVLEHEGGLSDNKADPGDITKYGISLRFIKSEKLDINGDGVISKEDIINLNKAEANSIYFKYFWIKYRFNEIYNEIIATKAFAMAVNSGASQSIKLLKRAINKVISEPLSIDSTLDDETIDIINNVDCDRLHRAMIAVEKDFYLQIIKEHSQFVVFKEGWLKRASW